MIEAIIYDKPAIMGLVSPFSDVYMIVREGLAMKRISPLQRPHYFTSSYTYLFSKKVILLSFLG